MKTIVLGGVVVAALAACVPHPTHPTKVDCAIVMETTFTATFDTTPRGTNGGGIRPAPDPCTSGGILTPHTWTQTDATAFSICVAAGTTVETARERCRAHMESRPTAGNVTARPGVPWRMCPGTLRTLSTRNLGAGGTSPTLTENGCFEGTTLPLVR